MNNDVSIFTKIVSVFWLHLGRLLSQRNMLSPAEKCFLNVPTNNGVLAADSAFELSKLYFAHNFDKESVAVCEEALQRYPYHARLLCALGASQRRLGQIRAASDAYQKAVTLDPTNSQAWCNLGECYLSNGAAQTALTKCERALGLTPDLLEALLSRINILYELSRFDEAEAAAREAISIHPNSAALHASLAIVLLHTGKSRLAFGPAKKALELDPSCHEAKLCLPTMLAENNPETYAYLENEIAIKGGTAQRLALLAVAQQAKGDYAAAEISCNKALNRQPQNVLVLVTLAHCVSLRTDHRYAMELFERALAINPQMPGICSNLAFAATYLPDLSRQEVFDYQRNWANRFEKVDNIKLFSHKSDGQSDRSLRIGYVSGDFWKHPVGNLFRAVIRHHDRSQFKLYCYTTSKREDAITNEIKDLADSWVEAFAMTDDELAKQIYEDQIDILIDLSGHTAHNRLPVFVRKPAPIQVSWIGYFCSTGLDSIDYFITDPYTTPADSEQLFSENPVLLPHSRFCFSPPDFAPAIGEVPMIRSKQVTFGSFNRQEKLGDSVIEAWARIIQTVPNSRLILKGLGFAIDSVQENFRQRFAAHGVSSDQLELRPISEHALMLEQYNEIDIALDPFPFNGGMTTLEALWMGVPVITLAGQSVVSRQSLSILENLHLPELIFSDITAYCNGAVALANDTAKLQKFRQEIRHRMLSSPLCQQEQFVKDLEQLYRRMWQAWNRGEKFNEITFNRPTANNEISLADSIHV